MDLELDGSPYSAAPQFCGALSPNKVSTNYISPMNEGDLQKKKVVVD